MMDLTAPSVSELVSSIKGFLEREFNEVIVQGEVSNLSLSGAGHWYFTLSDQESSISCALFKGDALRNSLIKNLKDGDKLIILGFLSVYQKRGTFQILGKKIFPAGVGQLKIQYERLKNKLSQEGLFDLERKKTLPKFPTRIAVITAEHGAALQDFLNVLKRRTLWMDVLIIPSVVQGQAAPASLIDALEKAQKINDIDVIVLTRGGGSFEDLWAFNDENLIRKISESTVPVLSAIGHEVDHTLCDYVSDYRCETPTAAAETLSQPQTELKSRLVYCQTHLRSELFKKFQHVQLMSQKFHPRELLNMMKEKVYRAEKKLNAFNFTDRAEELLSLPFFRQRLDEASLRINHWNQIKFSGLWEKINSFEKILMVLNPKNVLLRGYSYVKIKNGESVSSLKEFNKIQKGADLEVCFFDGNGKVLKG